MIVRRTKSEARSTNRNAGAQRRFGFRISDFVLGSPRGFTLVETIMVIALSTVVMLALSSLIVYFYKTNAFVLEQSQAVNSARLSIQHAMADLREAAYGADGSYPLNAAATSTVTFYAALGSTSTIDKVRYYLQGTTLYRGVTAPSGSPLTYAGQPEETTLVVDNIRNGTSTPLFTYYDSAGAALALPVNIASVASVRIQVLTDVNPQRAPLVYTLAGSATLRALHGMN